MTDINHALIQRFALTRPLIFEDIEHGHEVITEPHRTIIRSDAESLTEDLPEMLSIAKLAETDPLLGTFYSQPHPTDKEMKYLGQFAALCAPLKNAWVWRTMRCTVPDVYEREIAEMSALWDELTLRIAREQSSRPDLTSGSDAYISPSHPPQTLDMWAIMRENPENAVTLKLTGNRDNLPAWHRYISVLEAFIPLDPDPLLYTLLPDVTEADYRVRIVSEGGGVRVYDIRERKRGDLTAVTEALDRLHSAINLMEQSKGAVKSKTIAQARSEAEKARAILEKLL